VWFRTETVLINSTDAAAAAATATAAQFIALLSRAKLKGTLFASTAVVREELMNVSKLRCRMEPCRCAAVRGLCEPIPFRLMREQGPAEKEFKLMASCKSVQIPVTHG
jgi:hypothetical protein